MTMACSTSPSVPQQRIEAADILTGTVVSVVDDVDTTPTTTPSATHTSRPTAIPEVTILSPLSVLPLPTDTPSPSPTTTSTSTPSATATDTPLPTATFTPAPTDTPTATPTPTLNSNPAQPESSLTVPILMYHYLSEPPSNADPIRIDLSVTPTEFEAQLNYLQQNNYNVLSMSEVHYALTGQTELPPKPIVLTFDDGHRDAYTNAFPILQKYRYKATFFIFTQVIDTYNVDYLTWEMVTEMHQAGMEFGSHSYTHPDLRNRDVDFLVYQIVGSKEAIEARINEPVRFFCYPGGRYDALVMQVLDSANFWGAVTTQWGAKHNYANRLEMPRIRMRGSFTVDTFAAILEDFD